MKHCLFTIGLIFIVLPGLVFAQEVSGTATQLPVITVVADKAPAPAQDVAGSLTAVTAETIRNDDVVTVKDASVFAPNVFVNEFGARKLSNPYFRGLGSSPNNPGVTTFIDGVPQLNANSSSIELLDVSQVEFVRGSQADLYGRDTTGGLINVTSERAPVRVTVSPIRASEQTCRRGIEQSPASGARPC